MGSAGGPVSSAGRYMAGLCVAALGVCAGGWLVLTPFAFGYPGHGRAAVTALATGGGLVVVCAVTVFCWTVLWRRKLRADGLLPVRESRRSRRSARRQDRAERLVRATRQRELVIAPDPAQVLTDLRALLTPLLANANANVNAHAGADDGAVNLVPPPATGAHDMAHDMDGVYHQEPAPAPPEPEPERERDLGGPGPAGVAEAADVKQITAAPHEASPEASRDTRHLRGTRSESFFAGAELLMVGTGEEEAW